MMSADRQQTSQAGLVCQEQRQKWGANWNNLARWVNFLSM